MISGSEKYSSAQYELQRLKDEKARIEKMQREKEKEYLRTDLDNIGSDATKTSMSKHTTIGDLFTKYGI